MLQRLIVPIDLSTEAAATKRYLLDLARTIDNVDTNVEVVVAEGAGAANATVGEASPV